MNEQKRGSKSRKIVMITVNVLLVMGLIVAIIWGISTYLDLDRDLYTNDAQVEQYINPVNARIPGYLREVRFEEHQRVRKGDTLVIIEDAEYKIQVEQAEAAWLSALAAKKVSASAVNTVSSNLTVSDANINASRARLWNASQNFRRYENLLKEGAATQQQFDQVKTEFESLQAQTAALVEQRRTVGLSTSETSRRVEVNEAEIKRTHAALQLARLNLSYTVITAPYDGVTGRRNIQEGQLVQPGQNLLSLVRNGNKWVVANYRETQLTGLHIGQHMKLKVDGLGGRELNGRIIAISEATGSKYSAVPVDNSTGNFVKVQQRVPVKIEILPEQNRLEVIAKLLAGMNVEVTVAGNK
ncbi:HlyD family secretion protein [Chitinophaga tropicalis]|uniref:HlyD family efflux transporter periplasmic adaptor subunit n=1 Tax=Chitinophaga tropicalis TaxID=2683588 RepID=A0A7K1U513_9BACT|nr:HlyD family secretion protein [Chitinophaga tropicalis]MVT09430.1 HlyD family efflux transporter periplasmic adaptor subunit [Chitinophaga tropicalis]